MANHKSSEKRARQTTTRTERNRKIRSQVRTVVKAAREAEPKAAADALSTAFSVVQKARGVLHRNAVKRKMSRLSKAIAQKAKQAS